MKKKLEKLRIQQRLTKSSTLTVSIASIAAIVAAILLFVVASRYNAKGIAEPMDALAVRLEEFAHGDLSSPFPEYHNDDEVGEMANGNFDIHTSCEEAYVGDFHPLLTATREMKVQIDNTLREVKEASDMVSAGALNLAEASQALAEGAEDQAASAQEMQATIDEITNVLSNTVDQTNDAYIDAERVAESAESSRSEMTVMVDAMNRINETSKNISETAYG